MCAGPKPEDEKHRLRFFFLKKERQKCARASDMFACSLLTAAKPRAAGSV